MQKKGGQIESSEEEFSSESNHNSDQGVAKN